MPDKLSTQERAALRAEIQADFERRYPHTVNSINNYPDDDALQVPLSDDDQAEWAEFYARYNQEQKS